MLEPSTMPTFRIWPRFKRCERLVSIGLATRPRASMRRGGKRAHERDADAVGLDQEIGPHDADLEAGGAGGIAGTGHWQAERNAIHGARRRHAERHETDATEILQRVEQARPDNFQRTAHACLGRTRLDQSKVPASTWRAIRHRRSGGRCGGRQANRQAPERPAARGAGRTSKVACGR